MPTNKYHIAAAVPEERILKTVTFLISVTCAECSSIQKTGVCGVCGGVFKHACMPSKYSVIHQMVENELVQNTLYVKTVKDLV